MQHSIEITSYRPTGEDNVAERFIKDRICEARKSTGKEPWTKVFSPKQGFRLCDKSGAETLLTLDSKDEQHIQYTLHSTSSDGESTIKSIEWVARGSEEESDLHTLYNLLEEKRPAVPETREISDPQQLIASVVAEQLVSALTVDARNVKSVIWTPDKDTGQEHCSYHAVGNTPGSKITIIPDDIGDNATTFTFIYEVEGVEIISTIEKAPVEAHSALRDLYYAVAGKDICEENFELNRISRFVASLREKDFLDRVLSDDFPQQSPVLVWDIFKRCNLRAVCSAYARTLTKQNPNAWTAERMDENFAAAKKLITQIRAIPRCPNGKLFKEKTSKVRLNSNMRYDTDALDSIANAGCTILQEFYSGLPEKCAINRTAHLLLVAMLN